MKIIFDIDGTILNSQNEMLNSANALLKKEGIKANLVINDWITYNPSHCFSQEYCEAIKKVWATPRIYTNVIPFSYVEKVMHSLSKENTIEICTFSGFDNYEALTKAKFTALKRLNIPFNHFYSFKKEEEKMAIMGDIYVDDSVDALLGNTNIKTKVLFTRPWNKNYNAEENGLIRINCFSELPQIIASL